MLKQIAEPEIPFPKVKLSVKHIHRKLQTPSKQTVWPLPKAEPKRGIQPAMTLKVNTNSNILFLEERLSKFKVGNIRNCYHEWERCTSDAKILGDSEKWFIDKL